MSALTEKLGCVFWFRFIIVLGFCLVVPSHYSFADDDADEYTQQLNFDHWLAVRALVQSFEDLESVIEQEWRPGLVEILSVTDAASMETLLVEDQEALKALGDTFAHQDWVPNTAALHRIALKQSYKKIEQPLRVVCSLLRDYYEKGWRSLNCADSSMKCNTL